MPAPDSGSSARVPRFCSARSASTASPPPTPTCGLSSTRTPGATSPGLVDWPNIAPLGDVGPTWERATPLRTEYERRAALVEIDALVAVWLGITEEQLEAIYPARYPVLGDYEDVTWFDATGRKIAGNWNTFGTGQTKEHWQQFEELPGGCGREPGPDGYTAPFYKADRVASTGRRTLCSPND